MKNAIEKLFGYRVKVEREGREVFNIPGVLALPGLLVAPKMSIIGMVAAPVLGCSIHVENEDGSKVDVGRKVQEVAETIVDSARKTAKTVREELDKAWESVSADDPEECHLGEENAEVTVEDPAETKPEDIPTIQVDDSTQA